MPYARVNITMPQWMLEDLRKRAEARDCTVTELIRRGVSLDKMLHEEGVELILRRDDGSEAILRLL